MIRLLLLVAIVCGATWHAWRWYFYRIWAAPEEGAALALSVLFVSALGWRERQASAQRVAVALPMVTAGVLLFIYALSFATPCPPIGRAALAICAAMACLYIGLTGSRPPVAFWGLIALSLPVLPSLQFTLGYGMRIVSAAATVVLLKAQGLDIARQGTFLLWRGEMVQFDAPCSGVNMLWAGMLVTFMGCVAFRFGLVRTVLAASAGIALTLAANVLRAASLFYIESGAMTEIPSSAHEAIGLVSFAFAAICLLWILRSLDTARWSPT